MCIRLVAAILIFNLQAMPDAKASNDLLTINRIHKDKEFFAEAQPAPIKWFGDGDYYTTVEKSVTIDGGFDIIKHDAATGESTVLINAGQLCLQKSQKPIEIKGYDWSGSGRYLLIHTNTVKFRRYEPLGDYWLLDLETDQLRQIGREAQPSSLMYAKFSPDSQYIAYLYKNNIFIESVQTRKTQQLTKDGGEFIVNGTGDWVNEEEFSLRDGFKWSPDSKRIAYWQFDTQGVGTFHMMKNTGGLYSKPIPLQYPKVGTKNSAVRVGTVDIKSATTKWIKLKRDPRQNYVPRVDWADNSDELLIQYTNRLQNRVEMILADVETGEPEVVFTDSDETWVDIRKNYLKFFNDGAYFTWMSERDGWNRFYRISRDGKEVTPLTPPQTDVMGALDIDRKNGWIYYYGSNNDTVGRYLFRSSLFTPGKTERITPDVRSSVHNYNLSPNSKWAIHTSSNFVTPPTISVVSLPAHNVRRTIVDNIELKSRLKTIQRGEAEFFKVNTDDGTSLDGWMMKPPNFDPNKRYPMLVHVYSEPYMVTVSNQWWQSKLRQAWHLWHIMLTQKGYLVVSIDSRGTPAPKGRAWRKSIYRQIGILSSADQAQAMKRLIAQRPYIDPERIGIWGWSGGGAMTLNALFRYPELYKVGIDVAGVTDQRLYNTIYQERYMGLPSDNAEGFYNGSPINFAENLEGKLLIIHGTADDNVHYQMAEQLVDKLIQEDKDFSLMIYPDADHLINEKDYWLPHLYRTMTNFLLVNLPVNQD
ncbi:MAG: S9 family peptidase [Pseudomonadota bacterium]